MTTINRLPLVETLSTADQIVTWSAANGDTRRAPLNTLLRFFQETFASPSLSTQLVVPGTGFNFAAEEQQWVLLQPVATLATGTVTLPINTSTPDGSEVLVTTTQQITAFTLAPNGASQLFGAPTTLAANAFFRMRFYASTNSWYRVS